MNDHEVDVLVTRAAPVTDRQLTEWAFDAPFGELREAIMAEPGPRRRADRGLGDPSRPHRWRRVAVLAAAAAAIVGVGFVVNVRGGDGRPTTAWAASLVDFAQRSPLLLMSDQAWQVTRADEYGDDGEMTFTSGDRNADLHWRTGPLRDWLDDRLNEGVDLGSHDVTNGVATVIQYRGTADFTALWQADGRVLEFRTLAASSDEFRSLLDRLTPVSIDTWLTAMPDSVIKQADQPAVIAEMLAGVPLPEGFDPTSIANDAAIKDRYQLGARVVAAVSCTWIRQWLDATASADTAAATAAVDAMSTSSEWPIIQEMTRSGDYGQVLQTFVDAMTTGSPVFNSKGPTVEESYQQALGCGQ